MIPLIKIVQSTKLYKLYKVSKTAKETQKWGPNDDSGFFFYSEFIKPKDVCFDIGANIGHRTKIFQRIVGPEGHVVAVEPQNYCMNILKKAYAKKQNIHLVNEALGDKQGKAEITISNETTVSSMSQDWIESVTTSNRFGSATEWGKSQKVTVTTLDNLVSTFGVPSFIKIDVEGYEKKVLLGLSRPISTCFSLEFTPEFLKSTFDCLDYLKQLGFINCNYAIGESLSLELSSWVSGERMKEILQKHQDDTKVFGDVYIQLNNKPIST